MNFETIYYIFIGFFPDKKYSTLSDTDGNIEICAIEDHIKSSVKYTKHDNHLQILEWDWDDQFPVNTILEGSPEDILKLAKLLEND